MKKKLILITGSSGFIGKFFLKDALNKGFYVVDILRNKNKSNKELNYLRKKYPKNYKTIFFKKNEQIKNKLKRIKIDYFINFATLYKNTHKFGDISKFLNSNIEFPTLILDQLNSNVKKIINFGTMMQHADGKNYKPRNFYASTKSAFEMILAFYETIHPKTKFYNLKFFESFSESDKRKKLIPTLFLNYKKNAKTFIKSKNLSLNIIHVNDILNAIYIVLKNNIESGSYGLIQKKNTQISKLIKIINIKKKRKLKVKYLNNQIDKIQKSKLKVLKKWKPDIKIEKKIQKMFNNENN